MTNETTTNAFLDELRSKTHESHQKLERLPVSASITNPNISVLQYARYLQLMHAVIAETESYIFPKVAAIVPDIESRAKLRLIENDLVAIGADIKKFSAVFDVQERSTAFALGMMYTVEGSTLGGRFILKNIESVLGFDQNNGAQFFFGYGNRTGLFWKNFLGCLDSAASEIENPAEIIAGAQYAFDAIYEHFLAHPL
jgi:heme oxygenase